MITIRYLQMNQILAIEVAVKCIKQTKLNFGIETCGNLFLYTEICMYVI